MNKTDNTLGKLLEAKVQPMNDELTALGTKIGKLYTDQGLPVDMALDRLTNYTKKQKLSILDGICRWLIEHKRNSGATEKSIDRQRQTNRQMFENFITKDETGAY